MKRESPSENIKIRPATPEDADFLSWVIYESSRSHMEKSIFEIMLQMEKSELLPLFKDLVLADPALNVWTCWDGFIIAEIEGKPVAGTLTPATPPNHTHYIHYTTLH